MLRLYLVAFIAAIFPVGPCSVVIRLAGPKWLPDCLRLLCIHSKDSLLKLIPVSTMAPPKVPLQVCTVSLPQGTKFLVHKISVEILVDEYVVVCDRLRHQTLLDYL